MGKLWFLILANKWSRWWSLGKAWWTRGGQALGRVGSSVSVAKQLGAAPLRAGSSAGNPQLALQKLPLGGESFINN